MIEFTTAMKDTHTILIPAMLPIHFEIIAGVLRHEGYKAEVLKTDHPGIIEEGLRSVHNDSCYPATLVIGQFIDALKSGNYDLKKTALLITQTGGGCRASNYIALLRKALVRNQLGYIPVISLNFSGLEAQSGFNLTTKTIRNMLAGFLYGDLLMTLRNQCVPYELTKGSAQARVDFWMALLPEKLAKGEFGKLKKNYAQIIEDFAGIVCDRSVAKPKIGIVGEIYVKYAPLGNNNLEEYLFEQGVEVVNSGVLDFLMYCLHTTVMDKTLYGMKVGFLNKFLLGHMMRRQKAMHRAIKKHSGVFHPPADFKQVMKMNKGYIHHAVKMGEGWLLTAEMVELLHSGVNNIITVQPFGCLPNHIVAKGMMRKIKQNHPDANIAAIDYDPGASRVNQENRLRLMLANAQ